MTGPASAISRRAAIALGGAAAIAAALGPAFGAAPAASRLAVLSRGFALPDWVDRDSARLPSEDVLAKLRSLGFAAVRLPVDAGQFSDASPATRLAAANRLSGALRTLDRLGFAATVDLHSTDELTAAFAGASAEAEAALVLAWQHLGEVIADFSAETVFPELLNEPPLWADRWLPLRDRLAAAVRARCPDHTLIWGACRFQAIGETLQTTPLADPNAIAAVHYYSPLGFTHQCEDWDGSAWGRFRNLPFPAQRDTAAVAALTRTLAAKGDQEALTELDSEFAHPWTAASIAKDFAAIGAWSRSNHCPVILNEFGVLGFCADPLSRAFWVRTVRQAAEQQGLAWNYWELDQGFGFINDRRSDKDFNMPLIEALLGKGS